MNNEKKHKVSKRYVIAIVVLSLFLLISVAGYGVMALHYEKQRADITLGDDLEISSVVNGSATGHILYPSIALPSVEYQQKVTIHTTKFSYLRAKINCVHDGMVDMVKASVYDTWLQGEDGYWYYMGDYKDRIDFVSSLVLPFALSEKRQSNIITITVESIVDPTSLNTVWNTAPIDWLNWVV